MYLECKTDELLLEPKFFQFFSSTTLYSFLPFFFIFVAFFPLFQSVSNNSLNSLFIFLFPILLYLLHSAGGRDNLIGIVTALWAGWMRSRDLVFLLFSVYFVLYVSLPLHLLQCRQYWLFIHSLLFVTSCVPYLIPTFLFYFHFRLQSLWGGGRFVFISLLFFYPFPSSTVQAPSSPLSYMTLFFSIPRANLVKFGTNNKKFCQFN